MKKMLAFLLVSIMSLSVLACSGETADDQTQADIQNEETTAEDHMEETTKEDTTKGETTEEESTEVLEPIVPMEELVGIWAANEEHALKLDEDGTAAYYELILEDEMLELAYIPWTINGNVLSFMDEWNYVYTYEIVIENGEISLKYIGDDGFHAINYVCADLTRYVADEDAATE